jgi:predicted ATP-grasp superfamily ATP-dependent carboligase
VTDARLGSALAVIRSLGRAGYRVVAADTSGFCPGIHSRFVSQRFRYPSPEIDPDAYASKMLRMVEQYAVDVIVPITDTAVLPLVAQRDVFESHVRLALPSDDALRAAADKEDTRKTAERLGIPVPATVCVETVDQARDAMDKRAWPIVLKPLSSKRYRIGERVEKFTVTYAANQDELDQRMNAYQGRCSVLLQEYCSGVGVGVELLCRNGKPLLAFQHRRLREYPVQGGPSSLRRSEPLDPELFGWATALLADWKWTGLAMVEFKVGPQGARLMEVNGRVWGSLPLAVASGVDFPAAWLNEVFGDALPIPAQPPPYTVGCCVRSLELEILWIAAVLLGVAHRKHPYLKAPSPVQAIKALAQLFYPAWTFDIQSWSDPLPGLIEIASIPLRLLNKARKPSTG